MHGKKPLVCCFFQGSLNITFHQALGHQTVLSGEKDLLYTKGFILKWLLIQYNMYP